MDPKKKVLGRGLDSLLPAARPVAPPQPAPAPVAGVQEVALDKIDPNPYQTRMVVNEAALAELADSIKQSGVVQPVVLRKVGERFQLIAGQRRVLASTKAGKTTIPAVVKQVSNEQAMEMTIVENLQREDLNPMEQARAFERLAKEFNLTQEQMAQRTGKERATVANFLRLLRLPSEVQSKVEQGSLSFGHAKVLLALPDPASMIKAAGQVERDAMSVRGTEKLVAEIIAGEPEKKAEKPPKPVDPNVKEAERELQRTLGCKVEVLDRRGRGKIVIQYASLEDFDRVVEMLSVRR